MKINFFGTLNFANLFNIVFCISLGAKFLFFSITTTATTVSPKSLSGIPITALSLISFILFKLSSTSLGGRHLSPSND